MGEDRYMRRGMDGKRDGWERRDEERGHMNGRKYIEESIV